MGRMESPVSSDQRRRGFHPLQRAFEFAFSFCIKWPRIGAFLAYLGGLPIVFSFPYLAFSPYAKLPEKSPIPEWQISIVLEFAYTCFCFWYMMKVKRQRADEE